MNYELLLRSYRREMLIYVHNETNIFNLLYFEIW